MKWVSIGDPAPWASATEKGAFLGPSKMIFVIGSPDPEKKKVTN
jgi:hypothetical protein